MINFLDNNFSDDRAHMLAVARLLGSHPRVRGWSALVTQNVLHDRELIRTLARLKCMVLFAGLESLDHEMLRRFNKTQNMSRRFSVVDDIAFAESLGISICYGYLFDYCHQTAAEMERQILAIARNPLMPMPVYLSVVAPLAGTASFWEGIDVPGERLSCVIMVRLPFPVPTEPVYAARAEQVRDGFAQLALPQAALRLKQGFGRLIRRSTDRGAVVILDNRILGRDYGKAFLDVLPPASRFVGPSSEIADRVGDWLGRD